MIIFLGNTTGTYRNSGLNSEDLLVIVENCVEEIPTSVFSFARRNQVLNVYWSFVGDMESNTFSKRQKHGQHTKPLLPGLRQNGEPAHSMRAALVIYRTGK
jgi:hypothetical protein